MDKKQQLEKLIIQLYDIGEKMNEMMVPDDMRAIDIDLLKNKVANLYDDILQLGKNSDIKQDEPVEQEQQNTQPADTDDTEDDSLFELDKKTDQDDKKEKIKEKIIEETKAQLDSKDGSKQKSAEKQEEEEKYSLHDELIKKFNKPDLSSKLQSKPIKDIHKAIGINERYTFIQELFEGDVNKYNHTINELNQKSNFNEAFEYIQKNFEWDINSPLVQYMLNLTRRKFISPNDG